MNKKEALIKNIIEKYNQNNLNSKYKINLEKPAKGLEEPFLIELKKEINIYMFEKKNKKYVKNEEFLDLKEDNKKNNKLTYDDDETIDINIIDKVIIFTKKILNKININFIYNKKIELKEIIFNNIKNKLIDFKLTEIAQQKINELIYNLIEDAIIEHISNDEELVNKELSKYFLKNILPEINEFYKRESYDKLNQLSHFQKFFFINSFIEYLEKKFLKKQLENKIITEENYSLLKSKIKVFIIKQEAFLKGISR